jgi:hypothetical protein
MTTMTATTPTTPVDPRAVAARTIGIALDCRGFGERRRGDLSRVEVDADKDLLNLTKHLIPRRNRRGDAAAVPDAAKNAAKALRAVERIDSQAQDYLKRIGLPSFFKPGTHRIALALVDEVETRMQEFADAREPAIDGFCVAYPDLVESMREPLGSQYRREDYPPVEDVKARFSFEWRWFELDGVPDRIDAVSTEAYRAAKKRLDANLREAAVEIRNALRGYLLEIVRDLSSKLAGENDAKPKQFRQKTVLSDLSEFFRTFPLRDVTDDAELAGVVARLRDLTAGVDLEDAKDNIATQQALRANLKATEASLADLLVERGSRYIELE